VTEFDIKFTGSEDVSKDIDRINKATGKLKRSFDAIKRVRIGGMFDSMRKGVGGLNLTLARVKSSIGSFGSRASAAFASVGRSALTAGRHIGSLAKSFASGALKVGAIGFVAAIAGAISAAVIDIRRMGEEIQKVSDIANSLGTSTKFIDKYKFLLQDIGNIGTEEAGASTVKAFRELSKLRSEGKKGKGAAVDPNDPGAAEGFGRFKTTLMNIDSRLGADVMKAVQSAKDEAQALDAVVNMISDAMAKSTISNAQATTLFEMLTGQGKAFTNLALASKDQRASVLQDAAKKRAFIDQEAIAKAAELDTALDSLSRTMQGLRLESFKAFVPVLQEIITSINSFVVENPESIKAALQSLAAVFREISGVALAMAGAAGSKLAGKSSADVQQQFDSTLDKLAPGMSDTIKGLRDALNAIIPPAWEVAKALGNVVKFVAALIPDAETRTREQIFKDSLAGKATEFMKPVLGIPDNRPKTGIDQAAEDLGAGRIGAEIEGSFGAGSAQAGDLISAKLLEVTSPWSAAVNGALMSVAPSIGAAIGQAARAIISTTPLNLNLVPSARGGNTRSRVNPSTVPSSGADGYSSGM
jgi:hypothetical protein